ncbi:hypothetical protein [uncultured Bdellovibrio sp.]|uniref:hypothetical protein n=1 Tax=Bdellovibrio sp. HCB-162 TaxID=3394234 RepID=UPI0025E5EE3C|nr:hypothetical protein [uncultured Bdellovibrio sp.]
MNLVELRQLIQTGVGMVMSTRNADMWPDLCEIVGLHLREEGKTMSVFVSQTQADHCLQNIKSNGAIAVSLSRPCTFEAAQIKGKVVGVRPMTDEEQNQSKAWAERFRKEIQLIGVTNEAAMGLKLQADTTLEVEVENIYLQTPGPRAGTKLELA